MRALIVAMLLLGCSPVGPPVAPYDAARDTPDDVRRDAPRDVPRDVPIETNPEWTVPPAVPERCTVERASHPERLPALTWEACGAGCTRSDLGTTWEAIDAWVVDGRTYFELLSREFGRGDTDALAPAEGPVIDAWRYPITGVAPACPMFWYEVAEARAAAFVVFLGDDDSRIIENQFWTFDLATGPSYGPADITLEPPMVGNGRNTQEYVVSPVLEAFRIGYGSVVVSHGGTLQQIFPSNGFDLGLVGDHLTFLDAGDAHALVQWTPERGLETLHDPADPLGYLRRDGTTLAWARLMDFVGSRATRAELWTADAVRDPALFAPRLVNDRIEPDGVLGGGVYAWQVNSAVGTEAHLIDLDTGRHRVLPSPPGTWCDTLYVSREEVGLACGEPAGHRWIYQIEPDVQATDAPAP